jgi:hypothetical protein
MERNRSVLDTPVGGADVGMTPTGAGAPPMPRGFGTPYPTPAAPATGGAAR